MYDLLVREIGLIAHADPVAGDDTPIPSLPHRRSWALAEREASRRR
jgi:hypothetical protein